MRYEDWLRYEQEAAQERAVRFGRPTMTDQERIRELRAELDGLAGRLRAELMAELRSEIERLIASISRDGDHELITQSPEQMEEHYASR